MKSDRESRSSQHVVENEVNRPSYRTEVLGQSDPFSWNAAIHYTSAQASDAPVQSTTNVSVGSITALLQRFG